MNKLIPEPKSYLAQQLPKRAIMNPNYLSLPSEWDSSVSQIEMLQRMLWNINQIIDVLEYYAEQMNEIEEDYQTVLNNYLALRSELVQMIEDYKIEINMRLDAQDERITQEFARQDQTIADKFAQQDQSIADKFAEQDARLDNFSDRLDAQDQTIADKFAQQDARLDNFSDRLDAQDQTIADAIDNQNAVINARIGNVLIIGGAWDSTKDYDRLTLVSYNGNTYISITDVPAGTPPTDLNYWVLNFTGSTGDVVPLIEALSLRVDNVENTLADKADQTDLDALANDISALSGAVASKADQTDLDALSNTVSALDTALQGKASQTELDALSNTVSALDTALQDKASQTDLDALSNTVSALDTALQDKASQTDLDALSNTVSALDTALQDKASQTELDALEELNEKEHAQYIHTFMANTFTLVSDGDWTGYYKSEKTVTVYNPSGSVRASASTLTAPASDKMKEAVAAMDFDASGTTLTAYAKEVPQINIIVSVEGVE